MSIQKVELQVGGAETQADSLKKKILNAVNCEIGNETVYYFSQNGNDNNDGLSPNTAKKSFLKVLELPLKDGDRVLFERGSIFRTEEKIELVNGVYYGAYGVGEKPKVYGSLKDYADSSLWCKTELENVWCTEIKTSEVAGMINFNNDESFGTWQEQIDDLKSDGDFYHDNEKGLFYLYLRNDNPGEFFHNIEIATTKMFMRAMRPDPAKNIKIENLCFKYATFGPIDICLAENVHITNCELGWHGGRVYRKKGNEVVRYGNAIEFWYRGNEITVDNCWIYQIFDAAITFQGFYDNQPYFTNVRFQNNLIEYCSMNIEYWAGRGTDEFPPHISDISFKGNIIRFGGYGWGGIQRCNKNGQGMILGWNYSYNDMNNFVITENILDCADCYMIHTRLPSMQAGLTAYGNTYFQKKSSGRHEFVQIVKGSDIIAQNQEDFEKAIYEFDCKPKLVKWLSE